MRKFLSLLLAAVLICSTILLPASAEESAIQEQPLAIQDEQISAQPFAWGSQSTYHICFVSDGRMLTGSGSSVYTSQYIQGNTSMQWVFQEYIFDPTTYMSATVIRLASNPTYVLSATTSGSVLLAPFSESSSYIQYWTTETISRNTYLATDSNFDGVGEYYLYYSNAGLAVSSYYYSSSLEIINPSRITTSATMTVRDIAVVVSNTTQIPVPEYDNIVVCLENPWLTYSSANTSICTVDSSGAVSGISAGNTTVTVTHKITNISSTCTVYVVNPSIRDITMVYPQGVSYSSFYSTLWNATNGFFNTFGILFSISMQSSSELTQILSGCNKASSEICDASCGNVEACNNMHTCNNNCANPCTSLNTHHRSAVRLLSVTPSGVSSPYTIRYIGSPLCAYMYNETIGYVSHYALNGATLTGTNHMVIYDDGSAVGTTQHEISHTFGTSDNYGEWNCSSPQCVMAGSVDAWCSKCFNIIMGNRNS